MVLPKSERETNEYGGKKMKNSFVKRNIMKIVGMVNAFALVVATMSIVPYCLFIIHQPEIPAELLEK